MMQRAAPCGPLRFFCAPLMLFAAQLKVRHEAKGEQVADTGNGGRIDPTRAALRVFDAFARTFGATMLAAVAFLALNEPWVSDDFNNAVFVREHPGFWDAMVGGYQTWSGRFASTAFSWLAIQMRPVYGIVIWLGFVLLVVMTFALARGRMPRAQRSDLYVLGLLLAAYWFGLPAIEETVFWASGSPVYLWPAVATLLFLYPYRRWDPKLQESRQGPLGLIASAAMMFLLGAWVGGSQEQVLVACLVFVGIVGFRTLREGALRRLPGHLYAGVAGLVLAGAVSLLAPGNTARLGAVPAMNVVETLIADVKYLAHIAVDWLPALVPWLLCIALLAVPLSRRAPSPRGSSAWWVWSLLGLASIAPLLWNPYFGAERTVMYLAVFLAVAAVSLSADEDAPRAGAIVPAQAASAMIALVLLVGTCDVVLSGLQARDLRAGQQQRAEIIAQQKAEGGVDVSVPRLTDETPRRGVAFGDGTADGSFWLNQILASYYGVNTLVVKEPPLPADE